MRLASSWSSALALGPAISHASSSTSCEDTGSERTGRLSPWRCAFLVERALPAAVFGPVLACALARFALILRSLVTRHSFLRPIACHRWLEFRHARAGARSPAACERAWPDGGRSRAKQRCETTPSP